MRASQRQPARNTVFAIHFVIKGAEKRRALAQTRARALQRELGVIPDWCALNRLARPASRFAPRTGKIAFIALAGDAVG